MESPREYFDGYNDGLYYGKRQGALLGYLTGIVMYLLGLLVATLI